MLELKSIIREYETLMIMRYTHFVYKWSYALKFDSIYVSRYSEFDTIFVFS